ncbi:probable RNA-directed DNA polymerase from transposon BS [Trichonephila clavipes]|nr:probable RNA-directed DNA polymerase from transposon BS [Trichonephila clavipes]
MDLEKTSPSEIQGFIKNLKSSKSPGIDLITNRILKSLLTKFIIFIALLFNMLLENCYFPKSWRMAVVIPILKPNSDYSNPQNYRPISVLCSLSKAYEFVILIRLNHHCLARDIIIIPEQHGFVTKCSTVAQLLRVTELVRTGFQNHQTMGMLFLDIAKAFDKIWHDGLISKMMRLGFSDQILKIIHSYLNSREFRVRVENCLSSPRRVKSGIPQGSLLEPRLFNLYINDIPKADNVHLAMYADDTAIISQHTYNFKIIERLQNYITRLQLWLVAWKIKVIASKSASLLFTKQRSIGNLPNTYILDQPVPWATIFERQAKFLNIPEKTWTAYLIGSLPPDIAQLIAREDEDDAQNDSLRSEMKSNPNQTFKKKEEFRKPFPIKKNQPVGGSHDNPSPGPSRTVPRFPSYKTEGRNPIQCDGCGTLGVVKSKCLTSTRANEMETAVNCMTLFNLNSNLYPTSVIVLKIFGEKIAVCADTGAFHTIAGEKLFKFLQEHDVTFQNKRISFMMADGIQQTIIALSTVVDLYIEGKAIPTQFYVLPEAKGNKTLLRLNFLNAAGIVLDVQGEKWHFSGNPRKQYKFFKKTLEDITLLFLRQIELNTLLPTKFSLKEE